MRKYIFFLFAAVCAAILHAQPVISITGSGSLAEQFKSALNKYSSGDYFWIGYSIQENDKYQVMMGSYYYSDEFKDVSLRDIILNTQRAKDFESLFSKKGRKRSAHSGFITNYGISINDKKEGDKETAILFLYDKNSKDINDFLEVGVCNLSYNYDLQGFPLVWLEIQDNRNSVNFLLSLYSNADELHTKKGLAAAIGSHTDQSEAASFLTKLISGSEDTELRKDAAFWLGMQNNSEALNVLKKVINSDDVLEVRKNAVWGIGYIQLPEALDELINIARHNSTNEPRKNAIYALGNKAVKKAEEALKEVIDNDPDIEIKKTAVYALANNSDNNIPYLIKIAKTNPSIEVRKCAIYSLSNSEDERALEALIELTRE